MSDQSQASQLTPLKRALLALEDLQTRLDAVERARREPLAILGMGCRFPGANNPQAYWRLLHDGVDAISEVPPSRWDALEWYSENPNTPGKMNTRWGGFIGQVDQFDPQFFGISPREALHMDPQQRLLLEVAWEALENAGQPLEKLADTQTGVYIGISGNDYSRSQAGSYEQIEAYSGTGNALSIAANRLSYTFDLRGPSVALDTACSSSLVALHLAGQSLRSREIDLAIVGGVNLILSPEVTITLSQAQMMSPEGRCKTFDASADGYVRGEGCGVIVLKRLSDALHDRNPILAVVYGTAVNQDGKSNGLTAPNGLAQQRVIRAALQDARLSPEQIAYVEAQGTGTLLGDTIELRALSAVMGTRSQEKPLIVGSVKTNIGHLEAASGMASLIKVVLALQNNEIPAHLHLRQLNPYIQLDGMQVVIPTQRKAWPGNDGLRYAGVSGFGFGGTNAHVILGDLAEAPAKQETLPPSPELARPPFHIFPVSASSPAALKNLAERYESYLVEGRSVATLKIDEVCYTASTGRSHLEQRLAIIAPSVRDLRQKLGEYVTSQHASEEESIQPQTVSPELDPDLFSSTLSAWRQRKDGRPAKVAFLFTGHGVQYTGMCRQLYDTQPVFRQQLNHCATILARYMPRPLLDVLFHHDQPPAGHTSLVDDTAYSQPALFAIEYALAQLWMSWGVKPAFLSGHDVGEFTAACLAGIFTLEDGLRLVVEYSRMIAELPGNGAMTILSTAPATVEAAINHLPESLRSQVGLAALDGPRSTTITGVREAVQAVTKHLEQQGIASCSIHTAHAFHSPLLASIYPSFIETASQITYRPAHIPLVANLTGELIGTRATLNSEYWGKQILNTVNFHKGILQLADQGANVIIEIGPHPTSIEAAKQCLDSTYNVHNLLWLPSLIQHQSDWLVILRSLAAYYVAGLKVNWEGFYPQPAARFAPGLLPNYPFEHERYWYSVKSRSPNSRTQELASEEMIPTSEVKRPTSADDLQVGNQGVAVLDYLALITKTDQQRLNLMRDFLRYQLATVLRLNPDRIDVHRPIHYMGLDSIMAIELKNSIEKTLNIDLPVVELIEGPSLTQLSSSLVSHVLSLASKPTSVEPGLLTSTLAQDNDQDHLSYLDEFPLSYGQQALWFQHQINPDSVFNPVYAVRIYTEVDALLFQNVFQVLVDRYPLLQTNFKFKQGEVTQFVRPGSKLAFEHVVEEGLDPSRLHERIARYADQVFDLEQGPVFRVVLFSLSKNDHILIISAHHLVVDLWSLALVVNDFSQLIQAIKSKPTPDTIDEWRQVADQALPPVTTLYPDFVRWQKLLLTGVEGQKLWEYWSRKLHGDLPVLDLPTDHLRPAVQTHNGASKSVWLPPDIKEKLVGLSEKHGATLFTILLAAFKILLYRYSGQEDMILGTPSTGRSRSELASQVGYFVNTLAIRSQLNPELKFVDFLMHVRQNVIEALAHQDYPFSLLVERLKPDRDPSRLPIVQAMFVYQRAHLLFDQGLSKFAIGMDGLKMNLGDLMVESFTLDQHKAQFDLTLIMAEVDGGLGATLNYNTDLFESQTILRLLNHFSLLIESIARDDEQKLATLSFLPEAELELVVSKLNDTYEEFSVRCVHHIFEEQAARTPDAVAVELEDRRVTYRELNRQANRLAHALQRMGIGPDQIVGICLDRSIDMIVSLLAVMKAGGAYLPMDPVYPLDRLGFMLQDAHMPVLLTHSSLIERLPTVTSRVLYLDKDWEATADVLVSIDEVQDGQSANIVADLDTNPQSDVKPENLAYVIYTSGSTGRSKGVLLEHRGLANLTRAQIRSFGVTSRSRVLQFASFSFDASVSEIFMALLSGASLVLARRETLLSIPDLHRTLCQSRITTVTLPPSLLMVLSPENLPDLTTIISAGEACSSELASRWAKGRTFINAYGPTEATIGPTYYQLPDVDELVKYAGMVSLPIGKPIANTQIYLLDKNFQPVPFGMTGEIFVGGMGVARGYLNRSELNAEKFIPNSFIHKRDTGILAYYSPNLYRTGDLARYLPDGNLDYQGRTDNQVKLRGFRIELGEIEAVLSQHLGVQQAVVIVLEDGQVARKDSGAPLVSREKRLVAYIVPVEGAQVSVSELRGLVRAKLPEYMLPATFVILKELPLSPNGKVDRRALEAMPITVTTDQDAKYVPPQTDLERAIAVIWQDVLNITKVGLDDNFFDLGGHSLLIYKVHGRLEVYLGRQFSMIELFRYPTVRVLAEYLGHTEEEKPTLQHSIDRADKQKEALRRQAERMKRLQRRS